jgi:hypothetical protein
MQIFELYFCKMSQSGLDNQLFLGCFKNSISTVPTIAAIAAIINAVSIKGV